MKVDAALFDAPVRILRGEDEVLDCVRDFANEPGQEDAFAVLDVGDLVHKVKTWRLKMPRVKPFYAVKCNDNRTVLQTMAAVGTGFDCASKAEIKLVLDLGVDPSRIIYAHPCKPASHLRYAHAVGVDLMTFDNETELAKVKDIMPDARLVIRIRCDAAKALCPLGEKFGAELDRVPFLLGTARGLGLNVVGVSFHVGSGCQELPVYARAIKASRQVFDLAAEMGFDPRIVDIGGGFPSDTGAIISEVAHYVNSALRDYFPQDDIQVIAEPGRYMVTSAMTVATQVVSKRRVEAPGAPPSFMYYINDGVYGSFNCILYDHQVVTPDVLCHDPDAEGADSPRALFACSIWGPTCDSLDKVVDETRLPELGVGDWLVWAGMGAYTLAAAGTFNGFPVPAVRVAVPLHTWLALEGARAPGDAQAQSTDVAARVYSQRYRQPLVAAPSPFPSAKDQQDHTINLLQIPEI